MSKFCDLTFDAIDSETINQLICFKIL